MSKLKLPKVTLITLSSIKIEETINSLKYSMKGIDFGEVVFVTHKKINLDKDGIKVYNVPKINYEGFSKLAVYDLPKWVKTDYMIMVAWDSAIINPEQWTDEFLEYDWVGPLWTTQHEYYDKNGNQVRVGNGNSLRSQKLIRMASELNLPWKPFTNNGKHKPGYWEDSWICVKNRHIYETHGCKFAPIELAARWGHENHTPPIKENKGIKPFLFHGKDISLGGL